jgi:hypothetical protein
MKFSPRRASFDRKVDREFHRKPHRKLYLNPMFAVIFSCALAWIFLSSSRLAAQTPFPQYGHKASAVKTPRALGLVQLSPTGNKARLTPIAIMVDGKFFDAGSYKAAPVPMALDFGVVYEGFRAGVSQGIFTISQPGQMSHTWIAEGTWLPAGQRSPEKSKKYSTPVIADDSKDGPPVLHRRHPEADSDGTDKAKDKDKTGANDKTGKDTDKDKNDQPNPTPGSTSTAAPPPTRPSPDPDPAKPTAAPPPAKPSSSSTTSKEASDDETIADPNRPRLRRGKPDTSSPSEPFTTFEPLPAAKAGAAPTIGSAAGKDAVSAPVFIPAISDAAGPDPRPYTYDVKPAEEADYRSKMLDLAAAQLRAQSNAAAKDALSTARRASASKGGGKSAKPAFDDVSLRIFDLSNSNQPVLVLSAKTHPPAAPATASVDQPKEIMLIARTNLEGELQRLFFSQTDSAHLDSTPRMELVDAVDADGDGRGELLFRRTFDDGSAYAIYRVTADRLWPLFEGTP